MSFIEKQAASKQTEKTHDATQEKIAAEREADPEFSVENLKIMSKIDFELLSSVYKRIAVSYGVESEKVNFIGPERITFYNNPRYDPETRVISIPYAELYEAAAGTGWELPRMFRVIQTTSHEEGHAIAHDTCRKDFTEWEEKNIKHRVGFIEELKTPIGKDSWGEDRIALFSILEEAMNEKLAREVTLEYLTATGEYNSKDIERFRDMVRSNDSRLSYPEVVKLLNLIIKKIAKTEGLRDEFVEQAFLKSRFNGESLSRDPELSKYFKNVFPEGFLSKLWGSRAYEDTIVQEMIHSLSSSLEGK